MTHYSNITAREILNDPMPEMSLLEIISMLFTVYVDTYVCIETLKTHSSG